QPGLQALPARRWLKWQFYRIECQPERSGQWPRFGLQRRFDRRGQRAAVNLTELGTSAGIAVLIASAAEHEQRRGTGMRLFDHPLSVPCVVAMILLDRERRI